MKRKRFLYILFTCWYQKENNIFLKHLLYNKKNQLVGITTPILDSRSLFNKIHPTIERANDTTNPITIIIAAILRCLL